MWLNPIQLSMQMVVWDFLLWRLCPWLADSFVFLMFCFWRDFFRDMKRKRKVVWDFCETLWASILSFRGTPWSYCTTYLVQVSLKNLQIPQKFTKHPLIKAIKFFFTIFIYLITIRNFYKLKLISIPISTNHLNLPQKLGHSH